MAEKSQEDHVREYITFMRQHFTTYHNHKEQMAYIATGLYLTGASALFFQKPLTVTNKLAYQCIMISIVLLFSLAAFEFVRWQIALRKVANDIIAACDFPRLTWLHNLPDDSDIIPVTYLRKPLKIDMPRMLYAELTHIRQTPSLERLTVLALGPILFGMFVLIGRLIILPP